MSKTRKISECVNVRINVGNYQHIELTKYAEEEVTYETKEELQTFENDLTTDLVNSLVRSMRSVPKQLGKGVENAQEVEEAIVTAIPEWLANSPLPNIANQAKKSNLKNAAEQKANKDNQSDVLDVDEVVTTQEAETPTEVVTEPEAAEPEVAEEDLFEEDESPAVSEAIEEVEQETTTVQVEEEESTQPEATSTEETVEVSESTQSEFDFFDDEDLFGDD